MRKGIAKTFFSAAILLALFPTVAFAEITSSDIQDILVRTQTLINPAIRLLLVVSYVMGIWFCVKGLLKFKAFAQPLTQMSQPGDLSGPVTYLIVGAVLIYIPTSTDVLSSTLFGTVPSMFPGGKPNVKHLGAASSLIGYASVTLESQWATLIDTVVYYMQFIGFLAFIRGWMLVVHTQQGQHEQMTKGIIHIVGGILAINFLPLVNAVINTISG